MTGPTTRSRLPFLAAILVFAVASIATSMALGGSAGTAAIVDARVAIVSGAALVVLFLADYSAWNARRWFLLALFVALGMYIAFADLPPLYRISRFCILAIGATAILWTTTPVSALVRRFGGSARLVAGAVILLDLVAAMAVLSTDFEVYITSLRAPLTAIADGRSFTGATTSLLVQSGFAQWNVQGPKGSAVGTTIGVDLARAGHADPWRVGKLLVLRPNATKLQCQIAMGGDPDADAVSEPYVRTAMLMGRFHCENLLMEDAAASRDLTKAMSSPLQSQVPQPCRTIALGQILLTGLDAGDQSAVLKYLGDQSAIAAKNSAQLLLNRKLIACLEKYRHYAATPRARLSPRPLH